MCIGLQSKKETLHMQCWQWAGKDSCKLTIPTPTNAPPPPPPLPLHPPHDHLFSNGPSVICKLTSREFISIILTLQLLQLTIWIFRAFYFLRLSVWKINNLYFYSRVLKVLFFKTIYLVTCLVSSS